MGISVLMVMYNDGVIIRKATYSDMDDLSDLYLGLPSSVRRLFHPFPFHTTRLKFIFVGMLIGQALINFLKYVTPRLGFVILVAKLNSTSRVDGFIYLRLLGKEQGKLIGSIGIVTREGSRMKGIGKKMYGSMISYSQKIGVARYRSIVIEDNVASLKLHQKIGYRVMGYTKDDYWDGEYMKNLRLEMDL